LCSALPELIDPGVTSFLADGVAAAALDRASIQRVAERRFGVDRMLDDYLNVYRRLLERGGQREAALRARLQLLAAP
jgi:hypothetical protein